MSSKAQSTRGAQQLPKKQARSAFAAVLGLALLAPLVTLRASSVRKSQGAKCPGAQGPNEPSIEAPDVAARPVVFAVLGFFAFVGLSILGLRLYYDWDVHGPVVSPPRPFAEPRLQSDPAADLRGFQAEQRRQLTGYAWVDQGQGLVRIPIERAMDLIAARGANAYGPLEPAADPSPIRVPEKRP